MPRVVHFLNQFFAGVGSEAQADVPPARIDAPAGPGRLLQSQGLDVVATLYCGDNYAAEHEGETRKRLAEMLAEIRPDVLIAGPAFASGRYGLACGLACQVAKGLGIPAVTAMHPENPGVEVYHKDTYIVPCSQLPTGMADAMKDLARLASRLGSGAELGPADQEGYIPRYRRNVFDPRTGAERLVDMLLARLYDRPFQTELPLPAFDNVPPAPPVADLSTARLAVVTTSGVVPTANPDRIESWRASRWARYPIGELDSLSAVEFTCVHGGFDNRFIRQDPNRAVPLDVLRELERDGRVGALHAELFSTVGNVEPVDRARRFGREIAAELRTAGVDAVLLTAT